MYKLAIFDLDGTLLNTIEDLGNACNYALEKNGFEIHEIEAYKKFVGNGRYKLIEGIVPTDGRNRETVGRVLKDFDIYYDKHMWDKTKAYDGIIEVLEKLSINNIKIAIVSNKPQEFVGKIVEKYFNGKIDIAYGHREGFNTKPDPTTVIEVMKHIGTSSQETIYIGDSNVDIYTANNANLKSIGVLWGFRDRKELVDAGATYIVSDVEKLKNIILG